MQAWKKISIILAIIPIFLAMYLASKPFILLKIPKVGFIIYAMAGGKVPPFFDSDIFKPENSKLWATTNDVFISSAGKSGSTWLMNTVHEIRTKGRPEPFRDIYEEVPFVEFMYYPGELQCLRSR
jgi:hypothetical protein